jgi:hypothetical protein
MSTFLSDVLKKVIISIPFLVLGFYLYGMHREHNDVNAAGMYGLVFIPQGFLTSAVCYALYFLTDITTKDSTWNILKYFVHLLILIPLYCLPSFLGVGFISILAVLIVLVVNVCTLLYDKFIKED